MDRYLGGEEIETVDAHRGPGEGGRPRHVLPGDAGLRARPASASTPCSRCSPAPSRRRWSTTCRRSPGSTARRATPLTCDPNGPLVAEVVKTTIDSYVGRVSLVRVFSGTLRPETVGARRPATAWPSAATPTTTPTSASPTSTRRSARSCARCRTCVAGDICAITKSSTAETGDTISTKDHAAADRRRGTCPSRCCRSRSWPRPAPTRTRWPRTWAGSSPATRRCAWSATPETHQLVLWCMGEAHADVVLDRLRAGGVELDTEPVRVALRETFGGPAKGHGRHVKQSGGHGQYAVCDIEVEPLPRGSGFEFVDKVVGGAVPHNYIPSRGEGRAGPDGARPRRRLPGGRPAGDAVRRQGAQRRLLRRRVPDRRLAGAQGRRREGSGEPARAGRRGDHPGAGRVRRRGDERPVRPARPGARHRARPGRPRADARSSAPRCRPPSWCATRSSCAR